MNLETNLDDLDVPLLDPNNPNAAPASLVLTRRKRSRSRIGSSSSSSSSSSMTGCCACDRWCKRHPRLRVAAIALGSVCALLVVVLGILGFLLYSAVDARLDQSRLLVELDSETLCAVSDMTPLSLRVVHGVIENPCVVPIAIRGGSFHVSLAETNELLARGSVPAFALSYGSVWLNDSLVSAAPQVPPTRVGELLRRLFEHEALVVVVEADVDVSVFGVPFSLPLRKELTLGGQQSMDGNGDKQQSELRWRSVALANNSAATLRLDVTLSTLLRVPMLRVVAPPSLEVNVVYGNEVVAVVTPRAAPTAPFWVFERGWATLATSVALPRAGAATTASLINLYLANQRFNATLIGSATAASFATCWAQQVLAATPLVVTGESASVSSTPTAKLSQLHVLGSDRNTLNLEVAVALKHEFDTDTRDLNETTSDGRIHLSGELPAFVVTLDARAAPLSDPLAASASERLEFGVMVGSAWELDNGPRGLLSVSVSNSSHAAVIVDALALHERNLWLEIDADAPPGSNDTLSAILDRVQFDIPFLVNTSSTAPKTSDVLLAALRIHVNDFDAQRVCADVTTSLKGSTFLADELDLRMNLSHIEASLRRGETNEYIGDAVVERALAFGSNISLLVCSRNLQPAVLARIITETVTDAAGVSVVASGAAPSAVAANASVVTRVLQHLSYTKVFVDAPQPGVPPAKHLHLKSVQSGGGRGTVAHVLVRYQMHGNKYVDLETPNVMLVAAAGTNKFLSVRILPLVLLRGNQTQEFEVLLDIDDVNRVGRIADQVLDGVSIAWTLLGSPLAALTARIQQYGRGTPLEARDTVLTPILNAWSYSVVLDKPSSEHVQGDDAVLPVVDVALLPGSTRHVLKLRLGLNLTMPASFLELVVGNLSFTMAPPGTPRFEFFNVRSENPVVLRPGLNELGFLFDVHADPADGTLQALQQSIFNVIATPNPVSVSLVGAVAPIEAPGGVDPSHEPPFSVYYDFVLPRGGAGNGTSVMLCQDNPVVNINYDALLLLRGKCSVDIQMKVWFRNPIGIPAKISQLAFSLEFDDPDGAFPSLHIYPSPKYDIVLGTEDDSTLNFSLPAYGIAPLNVVVKHPPVDPNGWQETCLRAASQYYVDNTLVVKLQHGIATILIDDIFQLPLRFANVSFNIDKNVKLNTTCENLLISQGILPKKM